MNAIHSTTEHALSRHYKIDTSFLPFSARAAFVPLFLDDETKSFLASCTPNRCIDTLATFLRVLLSVTDVNALLFRGGMFVLSTAQARTLLLSSTSSASASSTRPLNVLLDVGAGDGNVTSRFSPLFSNIEATEISWAMVLRLRLKGFRARGVTDLSHRTFPNAGAYDCVSLLNLLDRCDEPLAMLKNAARLAAKHDGTGRVIIALVLPFSDFVEEGARRRPPKVPLEMGGARCGDGATFELSLAAFIERVLPSAGLVLERLSRVPYLCRGDARRAYYVLSDAIMVLRPIIAKNHQSSYRSTSGDDDHVICEEEENTLLRRNNIGGDGNDNHDDGGGSTGSGGPPAIHIRL